MNVFNSLGSQDKINAIVGYASAVAYMLDNGYDPMYDPDVREAVNELWGSDMTEEQLEAASTGFYEIHDAILHLQNGR